MIETASNASQTFNDLGFALWETSARLAAYDSAYFDAYAARPRGSSAPYGFILKALRPRYCGTTFGRALIERARFLGSIDSRNILPIVDSALPRRVNEKLAFQGYLVSPRYAGVALSNAENFSTFRPKLHKETLRDQILGLATTLDRFGWRPTSLDPEQVLIANIADPLSFTIVLTDFRGVKRFETPSLFPREDENNDRKHQVFDKRCQLPPDVFYEPNATFLGAVRSFYRIFKDRCDLI